MGDDRRKNYCTIDHANKQKELARTTPYQFWLGQVSRNDPADSHPAGSDSTGKFLAGSAPQR